MEIPLVRNKPRIMKTYIFFILVTAELLMSFSFIGYFHIEPISITFAYIPVILAGCIVGPVSSTLVGAVFGLASMWKASATYVSAGDLIFSPVLSGHPISSILLSLGSRTAFGFLIGLLFLLAKKSKRYSLLLIAFISFFAPTIHSAFVYGFMGILFPDMGYTILSAFDGFHSISDVLTPVITLVLSILMYTLINSERFKAFEQKIQTVDHLNLNAYNHVILTVIMSIFSLVSAFAIGVYFLQRMSSALSFGGYILDNGTYYNLLHLQTQFLLGILSLVIFVALFLMLINSNVTYINHKAKSDSLTGVLNRNGFFPICEDLMSASTFKKPLTGYFIVLDIDYFKKINDIYGHPKGDDVLWAVANCLQEVFAPYGIVARIGGDEFAVLAHNEISRAILEAKLNTFIDKVHQIPCGERIVSCSIGVVPISSGKNINQLYHNADICLYKAKTNGRDQFYIGENQ